MMVLAIGGNNCTQVSETLLDAFHTTSAPQVSEALLMSSVLSHRVVRLHGHGGTYCTHVSETLLNVFHTKTSRDGAGHWGNLLY